jgi:hypothetical protein
VALCGALIPIAQLFLMRDMLGGSGAPDPRALLPRLVVIVPVALLLMLGMVLCYLALKIAAVDAVAGRPASMGDAFRRAVRPQYWLTQLLAGVGAFLGAMCCLIPGIHVMLLWAVAVPVMAEEGLFHSTALGRSAELMRHNPQGGIGNAPRFKFFLLAFVGMLLQYIANLVVQMPFMILQQVLMFRSMSGGQRPDPARLFEQMIWVSVPSQAIGMAVQMAIELYLAFGVALLYFDCRARREGSDLEAALGNLAPIAEPTA